MINLVAINRKLVEINDYVQHGYEAASEKNYKAKLDYARAAFVLICELREIADSSRDALDLEVFFAVVQAYEKATKQLIDLLLD